MNGKKRKVSTISRSPGIDLPEYHCLRCDFRWIPRENRPKECPNCHSRKWWIPTKD